jgi:hypothetical protein
MLLDRRRRPCFWVLGDNRCGPSISEEKEMARGASREDLEVWDARLTARARKIKLEERVEGERGGKRSVGMKVAHGPELQNWSRADRLSGSRGCLVFCLPGPLCGYQTLCKSRKIPGCDRKLSHLVQLCTREEKE